MARKALRKQRAYQKHCRDQVFSGLVNAADGSWVRASSRAMDRDMAAGYKVNRAPRRKVKAPVEVE